MRPSPARPKLAWPKPARLRPASGSAPRRDAGFTLLEVLVAAVIAGLALGVLFQGAAGGVRSARVAGHVQEATSRARSRLAVLSHGPVPPLGDQDGDDGGGYRWRTHVDRVASGSGVVLLDLGVALAWSMDGGERAVELHTRRVAPAPPEPP